MAILLERNEIMSKLLHIDSSGKGNASTTRVLTEYFAKIWKANNRDGVVVTRDLLATDLPPITPEFTGAMFTPAESLTEAQKKALAPSNELVEEVLEADTYIFGVPMYNFSVPGVFKLYIDQIVRAGKTFSYSTGIPEGLLKNKKLIVVTAHGADYTTSPMKELDFVEPYLRAIFGFLGVKTIEFVTVAGRDPQVVSDGIELAKRRMDVIVAAGMVAQRD